MVLKKKSMDKKYLNWTISTGKFLHLIQKYFRDIESFMWEEIKLFSPIKHTQWLYTSQQSLVNIQKICIAWKIFPMDFKFKLGFFCIFSLVDVSLRYIKLFWKIFCGVYMLHGLSDLWLKHKQNNSAFCPISQFSELQVAFYWVVTLEDSSTLW